MIMGLRRKLVENFYIMNQPQGVLYLRAMVQLFVSGENARMLRRVPNHKHGFRDLGPAPIASAVFGEVINLMSIYLVVLQSQLFNDNS